MPPYKVLCICVCLYVWLWWSTKIIYDTFSIDIAPLYLCYESSVDSDHLSWVFAMTTHNRPRHHSAQHYRLKLATQQAMYSCIQVRQDLQLRVHSSVSHKTSYMLPPAKLRKLHTHTVCHIAESHSQSCDRQPVLCYMSQSMVTCSAMKFHPLSSRTHS